jgi:hypothetical protein
MSEFMRIRMSLARTRAFPEGSNRHGYEFVAPLDDAGHIDRHAWTDSKAACVVHRFWGAEEEQRGRLTYRTKGQGKPGWVFDYDIEDDADDEAGFRFQDRVFRSGDYVSLTEADGEVHTFRVDVVEPL